MTETALRNLAYVSENDSVFNSVKFYTDADSERLKMVYYNSDSDSGGQLVENILYADMLTEAFIECKTEEEFWNRLDERARQYLTDIDAPEFEAEAKAFVENSCDFRGQDHLTMEEIRSWVSGQCAITEQVRSEPSGIDDHDRSDMVMLM